MIAGKFLRRRAGHGTDLRAVADEQIDLAAKLQGAFDDRVRADHDARFAVAPVEPVEPVVLLVDEDAALDSRIGADLDVAADRLDTAADMRGVEREAAVDVRDMPDDIRALAELHAAVDRLDGFRDLRAGTELDAAVHGFERIGARALADVDA